MTEIYRDQNLYHGPSDLPTEPYTHDGYAHDDRSVKDLLTDIRDGGMKLMRQELALARTEIKEEVGRTARGATTAGIGGVLATAGLIVVLMALGALLSVLLFVAGVDLVWASWLGPLIIGLACALIGGAMLAGGIKKIRNQSFVPRDTVKTLKENKRWIEQKV